MIEKYENNMFTLTEENEKLAQQIISAMNEAKNSKAEFIPFEGVHLFIVKDGTVEADLAKEEKAAIMGTLADEEGNQFLITDK